MSKPLDPTIEKAITDFFSQDDVRRWLTGKITLQELNGITPARMAEIAESGYNLYLHGRYDEARIIFEGLTALNPLEFYYFLALGVVYLAQDELEMAERLLTRASQLNNMDQATFVNRGEVLLRLGRFEEALADFERAVTIDPSGKQPFTSRAQALVRTTQDALKFLEENQEEIERLLEEEEKKQKDATK